MTNATLDAIFSDHGVSPFGSNKGIRVTEFLKKYMGDEEAFAKAFSDIAHPNNLPAAHADDIMHDIKEAFAKDGFVVVWHNGAYEIRHSEDVIDRALTQPAGQPDIAAEEQHRDGKLAHKKSNIRLMDNSKVFVVHGQDAARTRSFFSFLRSAGLQPLEWGQVVSDLGKGSPYTLEVINHGFAIAQAVVVFATPDEEAALREELRGDGSADVERQQPRPNVLIELGMAMAIQADRTVVVAIGEVSLGSDLDGINVVHFDGGGPSRNHVLQRLKSAGCAVNMSGAHWMTEGSF